MLWKNKGKMLAFSMLACIFLFWYFFNCFKSIVPVTPRMVSLLVLLVIVDVFFYPFMAIPWVLLPKIIKMEWQHFLINFFVALLCCVIAVSIMAFINIKIFDLVFADGSTGKYSVSFFANLRTHTPFMMAFGWAISSWTIAEKNKAVAEREKVIIEREKANIEREKACIEKESLIAQARLLGAQLHPHVFCNVLAGIHRLIDIDKEAARKGIRDLADYSRHLLNATKNEMCTLAEECNLLGTYLDIEKIILMDRLSIHWELDKKLNDFKLPPLIMQPLVENAIKHGIAPNTQGGEIFIETELMENNLRLAIHNTGVPLKEGQDNGIGISNLRDRLKHVYGDKAFFDLYTENEWTVAEVLIPV